ncbi:hypothetical protein [Deinococcus arcticus]|uniref:Lipoprotein n=1 Tax=Deinococcus arcticus TaxID=2136176 RepID=A0A2T3W5D9_9DEIO|nr:hypothetical protein [Deinococcus arcticus]PTA67110.1 hypothetical protein C8263_14435 [Deinococcus arcticus]
MRRLLLTLGLLTAGTLTACTGTEETTPPLRLVVLEGAATLRALNLTTSAAAAAPTVTPGPTAAVTGGLSVHPTADARQFLLVRTEAAERRTPDLAVSTTFPAPGFTPVCFTRAAQNPGLDRLLVLSDCSGAQRLSLYQDARLVWQTPLPLFLAPTPGVATPPVRLAVQGEVGVVARPRLGGGSEVLRVAVPVGGAAPQVSEPQPSAAIYDLAAYGSDLLAATDTGVQRLNAAGLPDPATTISALGTARYDRLWTGAPGRLLAAWRSDVGTGLGPQPLRVWNGTSTEANSAATVATFSDLRDLTFTPDGFLYTLTASTLTRLDTLRGLQSGAWNPVTLPGPFNDARSLTWVVPPEAPSGGP